MPVRNTAAPAGNPARVMWVLHGAFMLAVVIYFLIHHFLLLPQAPPPARQPVIFGVFCLISILSVAGGFLLPRLAAFQSADSDSAAGYLIRKQAALIVSDACFESIAVYGLVGVFLGFTALQSRLLMLAGLLLLCTRLGWIAARLDEHRRRLRRE